MGCVRVEKTMGMRWSEIFFKKMKRNTCGIRLEDVAETQQWKQKKYEMLFLKYI